MADYKYRLKFSQIVDEMGDLKPLGVYQTDVIPQQNDQIAMVVTNEDGTPIQRLYFLVKHMVHYVEVGDKGMFYQNGDIIGELQVELLVDEPVG